MRLRATVVVVCACGILAVAAAPAPAATPQGPVAAVCLAVPGWQSVVREDGTAFTSGADCITYAARGGTLIFLQANASCTLGLGAQARDQLLWTCSVGGATLIQQLVNIAILNVYCVGFLDGRFTADTRGATAVASCYRR